MSKNYIAAVLFGVSVFAVSSASSVSRDVASEQTMAVAANDHGWSQVQLANIDTSRPQVQLANIDTSRPQVQLANIDTSRPQVQLTNIDTSRPQVVS